MTYSSSGLFLTISDVNFKWPIYYVFFKRSISDHFWHELQVAHLLRVLQAVQAVWRIYQVVHFCREFQATYFSRVLQAVHFWPVFQVVHLWRELQATHWTIKAQNLEGTKWKLIALTLLKKRLLTKKYDNHYKLPTSKLLMYFTTI